MPSRTDYYRILGVQPDADSVVIQGAYRALMRKYHPDTNREASASERAKAINEAFEVLSDSTRRALYDAERFTDRQQSQTEGARGPEAHSNAAEPVEPKIDGDKPKSPAGKRPLGCIVPIGFIAFIVVVLVGSNLSKKEPEVAATDAVQMPDSQSKIDQYLSNSRDAQSLAPFPTVEVPATRPSIFQSPLNFLDLEAAIKKYRRVALKSGKFSARQASQDCHSKLEQALTWSEVDQCIGFDIVAYQTELGVSKSIGGVLPPEAYFKFQNDHAIEAYGGLGVDSYTALKRVDGIRNAVEGMVQPLILERLRPATDDDGPPLVESGPDKPGTSN
jgi:hypothetical protein